MKVNIVYWSATGNTEAMAYAAEEGAKGAGAQVDLMPVSAADASVLDCDVLLLGCPAMGAEELEEGEFEPFFSSIEGSLSGKKLGLFGSYDWGDGEWMRTWQDRAAADGAVLIADGVIANLTPRRRSFGGVQAAGRGRRKGLIKTYKLCVPYIIPPNKKVRPV